MGDGATRADNGRSHRLLLAIGSAALAAVVSVALFIRAGGDDSATTPSNGTPQTSDVGFPVPRADVARSTLDYLAADGRPLLVMHEHAKSLLDSGMVQDRCRQEATDLDDTASADDVLGLIGGITDPVLRAALDQERTSLGVAYTQCIGGQPERDDQVPLNLGRSVEAVSVRLVELKAAA